MSLKKMLNSCKKQKKLFVERHGSQHFLDNGHMKFDISDIAPAWSAEDCIIALELTKDDLEKMEYGDVDASNFLSPDDPRLIEVHTIGISICFANMEVCPFLTPDKKVFFVNTEELDLFKKVYGLKFKLNTEPNEKHREYGLYVFSDSYCVGMIKPIFVYLERLNKCLGILKEGVARSLYTHFLDAGGQVSLDDISNSDADDEADGGDD